MDRRRSGEGPPARLLLPGGKPREGLSVPLEPGDVVVLFSDGVTEAIRPGTREEFGEARLGKLIAQHRGDSAERLVERLRDAVTAWCAGAPPADDITLVVAKRPRRRRPRRSHRHVLAAAKCRQYTRAITSSGEAP